MMFRFIAAACFVIVPVYASAQTYRAYNQLTVVPLDNTSFEVIEGRGEGPRGIWCAAADYAFQVKGLSNGARVYILRERGNSISGAGRKSVVFTTDAKQLPQRPRKSTSLSTSQVGVGLPVNHARGFCEDVIIERIDRFRRIFD